MGDPLFFLRVSLSPTSIVSVSPSISLARSPADPPARPPVAPQTTRIVVSSVKLDIFGSDGPTASPPSTSGDAGPSVDELGYVEFTAVVDGQLELHLGVPGVDLEQECILNTDAATAHGVADGATGDTGNTTQSGDTGAEAKRHRAAWFRSDTESRLPFAKGRHWVGLTELVGHAELVAAAAAADAAGPASAGPHKPGKRRFEVQWPAVLLFYPDELVGCCSLVTVMTCRPAGASTAGHSPASAGAAVPAATPASLRIVQSLAVTGAGDILELQEVFEPASGGGDSGTDAEAMCTICLDPDEKCNAVLMPCRHRCVCHACLPKIEHRVCPICRCRIEYVLDEDTAAESNWV